MRLAINLKDYIIEPIFYAKNQYSVYIKTYLHIETVEVLLENLGSYMHHTPVNQSLKHRS